jgi:hypothetical protein
MVPQPVEQPPDAPANRRPFVALLERFTYSAPWPDDMAAFSIGHDREMRDLKELEGVEP